MVNTTANNLWTISIGPTAGASAQWSGGGLKMYDFNDTTTGGCADGSDADTTAGSLTIDPSNATITPDASCGATGVNLGTASTFSEGVTDSINLLSGTASAEINCMWNITGISVTQQIPPETADGSYSLGLTITKTAN